MDISIVPVKDLVEAAEDAFNLAKGQNVIDIHIEAGIISDEALKSFHDLGIDNEDPSLITTFVLFDFYEFETQVTPLGLGLKPHYGHTSRFQIYVDDFFLYYLQRNPMTFHVCRSNGIEFLEIGTCVVTFQDLLKVTDKVGKHQYYGDIMSLQDKNKGIGKLDYSLSVQIPMAQAIRAFKERIVALNLLTAGEKDETE